MYEYLCLAQSKDNFDKVWAGVAKNSSTFKVEFPGKKTPDEIKVLAEEELNKPIPEDIPGQHTVWRIGPIEVTGPKLDKDGKIVTPAVNLKGNPGDAYAGIIKLYRKARPDEIAIANMFGVGVFARGFNDEGLEIAPLVEKWRQFQ